MYCFTLAAASAWLPWLGLAAARSHSAVWLVPTIALLALPLILLIRARNVVVAHGARLVAPWMASVGGVVVPWPFAIAAFYWIDSHGSINYPRLLVLLLDPLALFLQTIATGAMIPIAMGVSIVTLAWLAKPSRLHCNKNSSMASVARECDVGGS